MTDSVAKRGRPKLPKVPKLSCLKRRGDNSQGFIYDNTIWHKNADSFRGLKAERDGVNKKDKILLKKDETYKKIWRIHDDIVLLEADRNMINRNEWISDSIVNASQALLQRQYPEIKGLQNVLLCEISANQKIDWNLVSRYNKEYKKLTENKRTAKRGVEKFRKKLKNATTEDELKDAETRLKESEELNGQLDKQLAQHKKSEIKVEGLQPLEKGSKFVQILLDRTANRSHWICVSNLRTDDFKTVRIYDNDLEQINYSTENYSVYLKKILKRLYSDSDEILIELPLVSQSDDKTSGGVYAIAFAEALCSGLDPSDILFSKSTKEMRTHLYLSLERGSFDRFPTGKHCKIRCCEVWRSTQQSKDKKKRNFMIKT